jgi:hypothetical protein
VCQVAEEFLLHVMGHVRLILIQVKMDAGRQHRHSGMKSGNSVRLGHDASFIAFIVMFFRHLLIEKSGYDSLKRYASC